MIKLVNLSKYYYSSRSVALGLRKINLEFEKGEYVAITGESGSGKTTLLGTISGLLPYEEGELYFEGEATSHYDEKDWEQYRKNHIAFVFQNYDLIDSYTALENVMSALFIQGMDKRTAKERGMKLLERVGIGEYAGHRASQLSSGQKQRLSIARALAKDTEVIVADEPTGNLDTENGKQIMELFAGLASERLIIVVTHNYEEAAPYVTRKIRIHEGEVQEDILLREKYGKEKEAPARPEYGAGQKHDRAGIRRIVMNFVRMELLSKPRKGILITIFLFFAAAASFLFYGSFIANLDDTFTKNYKNDAFYNSSDKRIEVRHPDGGEITQEDLAYFEALPYVKEVQEYGTAQDIFYFSEEGTDYMIYSLGTADSVTGDIVYYPSVYLNNYHKYVFCSNRLTQEDLAYGRLPEKGNELVLYAKDDSVLGSVVTCYFNNTRDWPVNSSISMDFTVCGVLKEPTDQYYFPEDIVKALAISAMGYTTLYKADTQVKPDSAVFYTDANYELDPNMVMLSRNEYELIASASRLVLEIYDEKAGTDAGVCILEKAPGMRYDEEQKIMLTYAPGVVSWDFHYSSDGIMMLSKEAFDSLTAEIQNTQSSIYITDYAYMDDTIKTLTKAGYEAVSPFRLGSVSYNADKVKERLVTLSLSIGAMAVLFVLEIIIVNALLRTGKKDCVILKSIGMEQKVLKRINRGSFLCYEAAAFVIMLAAAAVSSRFVSQVRALFIYYRFYHFLILFALNVGAALIAVLWYNWGLGRQLQAGKEGRA